MPEGIFKNEVKLPKKNISLKSRKIRKIDAREMRKRQKRSKFHVDHFQSETFFPISNRKGAYDVIKWCLVDMSPYGPIGH